MQILANDKAKSTGIKTVALNLVSLDWQYGFVWIDCGGIVGMSGKHGSGFAVSSL